jgi:uncharacterized protein YjbJ (UPF0337 family)
MIDTDDLHGANLLSILASCHYRYNNQFYLNTIAMNKLELFGNWNIIKGKLKERFGVLTDNDLLYIKGKEEELLGRIQRRLGKTKRELLELIGQITH